MFGNRRSKQPESVDWSGLSALMEDDDQRAAIQRVFPDEGRESFLTALRRIAPAKATELLAAGRKLHTAEQLVQWPTIAVAGMLNSGKTSLVATFLSDSGRARTLRGTNNNQGTHRFVLWLPSAWQEDAELWGLLMGRIGETLGQPPEMLAIEPAEAHSQYNNRAGDKNQLGVPLIATDERLNDFGIGLLDCPDIVSDEAFGLGSPEARRNLLGRAATLCSAFMVVSSGESSRDGTLGDLLRIASDLMPGIPRILAVNKIRARQTPDQVYETFGPLARSHGIETIYAAYDYEVPSSQPFIPTLDEPITAAITDDSETLPVFFSLAENPDENPPAAISADRLLSGLPLRLDRGKLFEKFRLALESGLRGSLWNDSLKLIDTRADQAQHDTGKAQDCLLQAAMEFFAHREVGGEVSELRLHQSERIIRQLSESFAVTAPWYARWGVRLNARVRRVFGGASDFINRLTPTAIAQRTAGEIKDKFRRGEYGGLMTPQRLAQAIDRHGAAISLKHCVGEVATAQPETWFGPAEEAIQRFERDDFTTLDPRRLDEAVRQMWREVPTHKKLAAGLTPLAAMLAAFGGVLMIPIDLGSSFIASASISELLAAAGLTTLSALWAGGQNTHNVGMQAARQQLADFHAVLCDAFGVARPTEPPFIRVGGSKEQLVAPKVAVVPPQGLSLQLYRVRNEFRQELQQFVPRNGSGNPS